MQVTDTEIVLANGRHDAQARPITRRLAGLVIADVERSHGRSYAWIVPADETLAGQRRTKALMKAYGALLKSDGRITVDGRDAADAVVAGLLEIIANPIKPRAKKTAALPPVDGIDVRVTDERIEIRFAKASGRIERMRALRGAKWDRDAMAWCIGARYRASLARWLAAEAELLAALPASRADRRALVQAAVLAAPGGDTVPASWIDGGGWLVIRTDYDAEAVELLRDAGATWDREHRLWQAPPEDAVRVAPVLPRVAEIAARQAEEVGDRYERLQEVRAAERAAAQALEQQAYDEQAIERPARPSHRIVVLERGGPSIGDVVMVRGELRAIESFGRTFRVDDDMPSMHGSSFLGHEGERCRYAYTRAVTDEQRAEHDQAEASRAARAERVHARRAAIDTVAGGEAAPDTGAEPVGDTIWRDDTSAAVGYRTWIVAGADGWLYHVIYDGSDGGTWGKFNAGHNTRAKRVQSTPELVRAISEEIR